MRCQGVRGATSAEENSTESILSATCELLQLLVETNGLQSGDVASVIFTVTPDLTAVFPARAARQMGWTDVPLFCAQEIAVPGDVPHCIRILVHWNTDKEQSEIKHVYLKAARALRPDLVR